MIENDRSLLDSALEWLSRDVPRLRREGTAGFSWTGIADELRGSPPRETAQAGGELRVAAAVGLGPYSIEQTGQRVELSTGGTVRWIVDADFFGGSPQVSVDVSATEALIELRDAFYPGTTIPAGLKARIFKDEKGTWLIRVRLKLGGFDATVPLDPWLARTQPAVAPITLDLSCCPLGPASELLAQGGGAGFFSADWVLYILGLDVFSLAGLPGNVRADAALVVPIPAGGPQALLPAALRRTALLFASDQEFSLVPELSAPWPRFNSSGFRFDGLYLEAGLDTAGAASRLLLAQSTNGERLGFEPAADLRGGDGEAFRVSLVNARYSMFFDDARTRRVSAFLGLMDQSMLWLHAPGASLAVTRSSQQTNLAAVDFSGLPVQALLTLTVTQIALRVPDLIVRPVPALRMELAFSWGPPVAPVPERNGHLEVDPASGSSVLRLPPNQSLEAVRRDDFLVLGYNFRNLRFESAELEGRLIPAGGNPAHLVVELPPQSFGEEAFFETATGYDPGQTDAPKVPPPPKDPDPPPVKALLAQPSRLVFEVPAEVPVLGLSSKRLLTWIDLTPSLAPTALPGKSFLLRPDQTTLFLPEHELPAGIARTVRRASLNVRPFEVLKVPLGEILEPTPPGLTATAIEAPFRLIMSPNKYGVWAHSLSPVGHGGRFELWHTRLGVRQGLAGVTENEPNFRTIRAIWARDYLIPTAEGKPFLISLSQDDRHILVRLTSDFSLPSAPTPVGVNRLMLTALGAWMDTEVKFKDPPDFLPIEEWQHRATLGRDHFVKVVYQGHLYHLGNRASVVKITERKVQPGPDGNPVAYLRQRIQVIVKEPERTYDGPGYQDGSGRGFPFKRVHILTKRTPNLDPPQSHPLGAVFAPAPLAKFWPHVLGLPFLFHVRTWDWEGVQRDYHVPLAFVRTDQDQGQALEDYNASPQSLRSALLGGQSVAFAETDAASLGKTRLETKGILFNAVTPSATGTKGTPCYPEIESAQVSLPALRQVAGSDGTATITLEPYKTLGFGAGNPAKLFASVKGASLDYAGKADKAGGVVTPNMAIRGLSRELGTVGDDGPQMRSGTFDPVAFFTGALPKLLGGISLIDILEAASGADFLGKTPKLVTENRDDLIRTRIDWSTDRLKKAPGYVPDPGAALSLSSVLVTHKAGGSTEFTLSGALTNFRLSLFDVVEVSFRTFSFKSENGKKPDFHVEVTGMEFLGDLSFVNALRNVMGTEHFTDPPFLDITPQGLAIGYTLTIPSVSVGIVGISNIALGARLALPFTGDPARLRFNLSERQSPFIVSVAPFGGGGFFAVVVGVDGLEMLEASLEFGGNLSIDLGVASGGVYVMAGIYFRLKLSTPASSELTGYVRLGGSLSVLGIIKVSIEFYLGLSYGDGKAWGEARVTVSIEILFFSADVTVSCRRQFAGSEGDPPFRVLMPPDPWQEYCEAFA